MYRFVVTVSGTSSVQSALFHSNSDFNLRLGLLYRLFSSFFEFHTKIYVLLVLHVQTISPFI